jgi:cytidine deaminase
VRLQATAAVAAAAAAAVAARTFVVPASVVAALRSRYSLSDASLLLALIPPARAAARPPVSAFRVGAAALGVSGAAYLGANLEFAGAPLHAAVHAEQFAVAVARGASERQLTALATSAAPCGHCRQFLWELPGAPALRCITAGGSSGGPSADAGTPLAQLLPAAFGPADLLGANAAPLLLQPRHNGVQLAPGGTAALAAARAAGDAALVEAIYAALAAANGAHAPYSGCPAGMSLLREGHLGAAGGFAVHAGGAAESAAFNPSLTPLHAACVAAAAAGCAPDWSDVTRAVLVERPGAPVAYAAATAALLAAFAPRCALTVLPAEGNLSPQWKTRAEELTPLA